jgi:hypothetical protein
MRAINVVRGVLILVALLLPLSAHLYDKKERAANLMLVQCVEYLRDMVGNDLSVDRAFASPYQPASQKAVQEVAAFLRATDADPSEILEPDVLVYFRVKDGPLEEGLCQYAARNFRGFPASSATLRQVVTKAPMARTPVLRPHLGMGDEVDYDNQIEKFLFGYRRLTSKVTVL